MEAVYLLKSIPGAREARYPNSSLQYEASIISGDRINGYRRRKKPDL